MTNDHFLVGKRFGGRSMRVSFHNVWQSADGSWIGGGHDNRQDSDYVAKACAEIDIKALYRIRVIPKVAI
ncbi:hypothetical protein [Mesorhizobium sp.]|uniref:hypothetical protein n=1 Tax=Mesorhizobium sp. TaxID=1871066 RepID=UPI000FE2A576|nr:hypothetical protein [Mesorhizobium sp.]RWJ03434.1 MAG: hypothetical protein EOR24_32145 [Mesorhizobium sp.]